MMAANSYAFRSSTEEITVGYDLFALPDIKVDAMEGIARVMSCIHEKSYLTDRYPSSYCKEVFAIFIGFRSIEVLSGA